MEELDALVTKVTEKTGRESGKRFRVRERQISEEDSGFL